MQKLVTFLMFEGSAFEAMSLYTSIFPRSEIVNITRYGPQGPGVEGTVVHATFTLDGQEFMAIDSAVKHQFTFTPAISIYVKCQTTSEIETAFAKLSEGGQVLMPLDKYPFAEKFGWLADKFGVSWQLILIGSRE